MDLNELFCVVRDMNSALGKAGICADRADDYRLPHELRKVAEHMKSGKINEAFAFIKTLNKHPVLEVPVSEGL